MDHETPTEDKWKVLNWEEFSDKEKAQWGDAIQQAAPKAEYDPRGVDQHVPGAKLDAGKPRLGLVFRSFARALKEVGVVGTYGANKYSPDGWLEVPDGQERYEDAMLRHYIDECIYGHFDPATNLYHAAQNAWNALAKLELMLREHAAEKFQRPEVKKS